MLDAIIKQWGSELNLPPTINGVRLLKAIAKRESAYGTIRTPRREKSYMLGGRNCDDAQRERIIKYGDAAAKSYSSWQIMFPVACELGYGGAPFGLDNDNEAIKWVVKLINKRILARDKADTVEEIADAYNSGNCTDKFVPKDYVRAVRRFYDEAKEA